MGLCSEYDSIYAAQTKARFTAMTPHHIIYEDACSGIIKPGRPFDNFRLCGHMVLPGQACHVGPAVFSRIINFHRGQGSCVVSPTHCNQTLWHCTQIKIHPSLVHRSTLQKHAILSLLCLNYSANERQQIGTVSDIYIYIYYYMFMLLNPLPV